jgi:predicted nucleic acid-binding protein
MQADILLIDERAGRQEAESRHIAVAGTLAVLLQASLRGYIDFPEAMKQLRQYGFRASQAVEASMLARYEQAKKRKP